MSSDRDPSEPVDDHAHPLISRRRFSATVAAGAVYAAFHPLGADRDLSAGAAARGGTRAMRDERRRPGGAARPQAGVGARGHDARTWRRSNASTRRSTPSSRSSPNRRWRARPGPTRRSCVGGPVGVLHGLPVAHKDLVDTAGIRTTRGSPFYRDNVPSRDALIVTRMRAAGAITVGKTNTPEFGAGSQTFNTVFGATRNPYDLTKTCGGSSGGAATAVAARMLPIADGSDTGGSLRNPPAFCNVVGLRPSPGRVASESTSWSPLSVSRTDRANRRRCRAVSQRDRRTGSSQSALDRRRPGAVSGAARKGLQGRSGRLVARPRRHSVRARDPPRRRRQSARSSRISAASSRKRSRTSPASTKRFRCFAMPPIIRSMRRSSAQRPEWVKDTIKFEVAQAERATAADVGRALARQARMFDQSRQFFERYAVLHPAGDAGRTVRREHAVSDRDCGHAR